MSIYPTPDSEARCFLLDHSIAIMGEPIPEGEPMDLWLLYLAKHSPQGTIRSMWAQKK